MGSSRRFLALKSRLSQLENDLLPPVSPIGAYTLQDQDKIRGYRILVHAEIEAFLEELAKDIVQKSYNNYKTTGRKNKILKSVVLACGRSFEPTSAKDIFDVATKSYLEIVKKNHGIKEYNVCSLFHSIGIDHALFDIGWLNTMNSYGEQRGMVAHGSFRVTIVLDPVVEKNTVNQLLNGLSQFDQQMMPIRRSI